MFFFWGVMVESSRCGGNSPGCISDCDYFLGAPGPSFWVLLHFLYSIYLVWFDLFMFRGCYLVWFGIFLFPSRERGGTWRWKLRGERIGWIPNKRRRKKEEEKERERENVMNRIETDNCGAWQVCSSAVSRIHTHLAQSGNAATRNVGSPGTGHVTLGKGGAALAGCLKFCANSTTLQS